MHTCITLYTQVSAHPDLEGMQADKPACAFLVEKCVGESVGTAGAMWICLEILPSGSDGDTNTPKNTDKEVSVSS
jgi:hypothetical protein